MVISGSRVLDEMQAVTADNPGEMQARSKFGAPGFI